MFSISSIASFISSDVQATGHKAEAQNNLVSFVYKAFKIVFVAKCKYISVRTSENFLLYHLINGSLRRLGTDTRFWQQNVKR